MINESTNEGTQAIIDRLFPELLDIRKDNPYYAEKLALSVGDHKTWARLMSTMFQHQAQETSVYDRYGWYLPVGALFHLQLNMIDMLLNNHYGSTKMKTSTRSNLRNHAEYWDRKKVRPEKWDFHATEELILQSYKARVIATLWSFVEENESARSELNLDDFKNWISNASMFDLLKRIEQVRVYLLTLTKETRQHDELRNHVLYCQQVEAYQLLKHAISTGDIGLLPHAIARVAVMFHGCKKFNYQIETLFMF